VLAQGASERDIVALVGARRPERVDDAVTAAALELSADDLTAIEAAVPSSAVAGDRYAAPLMALLDSER
jgi:aryl-alcohol dehydrogenase-like predicted oxidoreductase